MSTFPKDAWLHQPTIQFPAYDVQALLPTPQEVGPCPEDEFEVTTLGDQNGNLTQIAITPTGGDWNLADGLKQLGFGEGLVKNTMSNNLSLPFDGVVDAGSSVTFGIDNAGMVHISPTQAQLAQLNISMDQLSTICNLDTTSNTEAPSQATPIAAVAPEQAQGPIPTKQGVNIPNQVVTTSHQEPQITNPRNPEQPDLTSYLVCASPVVLILILASISQYLAPKKHKSNFSSQPEKNHTPAPIKPNIVPPSANIGNTIAKVATTVVPPREISTMSSPSADIGNTITKVITAVTQDQAIPRVKPPSLGDMIEARCYNRGPLYDSEKN
jgi:hypothetical protein